MQLLEPDSEQVKEVFARYGLAIYQSQCLERQLAILLAVESCSNSKSSSRQDFDKQLSNYFRMTLGALVRKAQSSLKLSGDLKSELNEVLENRNWLAHRYFWDRAPHFCNSRGRKIMLQELEGLEIRIGEAENSLTTMTTDWLNELGLNQIVINEQINVLLEEAGFQPLSFNC